MIGWCFEDEDDPLMNRFTPGIRLIAVAAIGLVVLSVVLYSRLGSEADHQETNDAFAPRDPFVSSDFVYVDAGSFRMGSDDSLAYPDEQPIRTITISQALYLGKTEVTQAQWTAVMGSNPSQFAGEDHPVDNAGWNDIQAFLDTLNEAAACNGCYRLPTEAEWEYAARAGASSVYSFGNDPDSLAEYAWFIGNAGSRTHPVGRKKPNAWGLFDMHGNVYEWVQDRYGPYDPSVTTDPQGPAEGAPFVLRGGSWTDAARELRVTYRDYYAPDHRHNFFGFRLVRTRAFEYTSE